MHTDLKLLKQGFLIPASAVEIGERNGEIKT
jgi:hypothetical protein